MFFRAEIPGAPHETLLVLDAVTGQNAIHQAKVFNETVELTGGRPDKTRRYCKKAALLLLYVVNWGCP